MHEASPLALEVTLIRGSQLYSTAPGRRGHRAYLKMRMCGPLGRAGDMTHARSTARERSPNPTYTDQRFVLPLPAPLPGSGSEEATCSVSLGLKVLGAHVVGRHAFLGEAAIELDVRRGDVTVRPKDRALDGPVGLKINVPVDVRVRLSDRDHKRAPEDCGEDDGGGDGGVLPGVVELSLALRRAGV